MNKRYAQYETADFLMDEFFRQWVREGAGNRELDRHWQQVIAAYPQKQEQINDAAHLIIALQEQPRFDHEHRRNAIWDQIKGQIAAAPPAPAPARIRRLSYLKYTAAAACLLLITAGIWQRYHRNKEHVIITGNGKHRIVELPDRSVITLGANSTLQYSSWAGNRPREVWLRGDASFEVRHLNRDTGHITAGDRFIVHVDRDVEVEVLGTVFMIRSRRGNTQVSLQSGSVKVHVNSTGNHVLLQPGEMVEVQPDRRLAHKTPANLPADQSWKEEHMLLNNTPVSEIARMLEDNYGRQLRTADKTLLEKRVDGMIPLDNEQQARQVLSSILDADIIVRGSEWTLQPRSAN